MSVEDMRLSQMRVAGFAVEADELRRYRAKLAALTAVHRPTEAGTCAECRDNYGYGEDWPCLTWELIAHLGRE